MKNSEIVVFVTDREGTEHIIEVPVDMNLNLMEVMKGSDLDVKATCGGMALCSTCHVYVLSNQQSLPEPTDAEEDMLDQAFDVEDNSRLSCQIKITPELNGMKVKLAPEGS